MKNNDDYIVDFANQIKKNGLWLSYDTEICQDDITNHEQKEFFMSQMNDVFSFDDKDHSHCKVERIFSFHAHFKRANILVKVSLDDFLVTPNLDGTQLRNLFISNQYSLYDFNKDDKGILIISHKKEIAEFSRAVEYDGNIMFLCAGNVEYLIDDELYDKDRTIMNDRNSGALQNYSNFNGRTYDYELNSVHNSIEDYFSMQRSIINLYIKKEEENIRNELKNANYKILDIQNRINGLNAQLNELNNEHNLQQSKIDLA